MTFNLSSSQTAAAAQGHVFGIDVGIGAPTSFSATPIKATNAPTLFNVTIPTSPTNITYVTVTKLTEALFGIVTLHSVTLADQIGVCSLIPVSAAPPRPNVPSVEFIGDSLTCGFGVLGVSPCHFSATTESVLEAFAGLVAQNLSEHAFVSW